MPDEDITRTDANIGLFETDERLEMMEDVGGGRKTSDSTTNTNFANDESEDVTDLDLHLPFESTLEAPNKQPLYLSETPGFEMVTSQMSRADTDVGEGIEVCVLGTNPRQGSIFRTNLLHRYGSKRFTYKIKPKNLCLSKQNYKIRMIPFVKCCTRKQAVWNLVRKSIPIYDLVIVTGDEYCLYKDSIPHFRQYYSAKSFIETRSVKIPSGIQNQKETLRFPLFMPLGPRSEFRLVEEFEISSATKRRYLFNFIGSLSSQTRKKLRQLLIPNDELTVVDDKPVKETQSLQRYLVHGKGFLHTAERWKQKINQGNGYISPEEYRTVLLDSSFTLCPAGHNPEAYRIYEACEAGSIPILVLNETLYSDHQCEDAYFPFLESRAPFIWLNTWAELEGFLEYAEEETSRDPQWLIRKQAQVHDWYVKYMTDFASKFEQVLEWRHGKRVGIRRQH